MNIRPATRADAIAITAAESFAIAHGCVRIDLNSANHRRDAHAFYQHHGYADQTDTSTRFLRSLPQSG